MIKIAPLNGSFMITSMLGFLFSILIVYPEYPPYGASFALIFVIMFIASMISFIYAPIEEYPHAGRKKIIIKF
jgi:predicted permease